MKSLLKPLAAALIAATSLTGSGRPRRQPGRRRNRAPPRRGRSRRTRSGKGHRLCGLHADVQRLRHAGAVQAGRRRRRAASRRKLGDRRQDLHVQAAHRREVPERQPADRRRRGVLARPHEGASARACPTSSPMSRRPRPSMPAPSSSRSPARTRRSSRRCCACRSSTRSWSWKISADGEGEMKDWGQAYLSTHGGGSGAYKVVSHNPQEETVMAKNADYFLGVPAKAPDTVRLRYGLEAATVRTLVAQGEHDITSQWLPPEVLKALAADGAQLLTESGGSRLLRQDEHDQEAARRRQLPHGADQRIRLRGGHPDGGDHRQGLARQPGDRRAAGRHARLAAGIRRLQARPRRGQEISRRHASTSRRTSTSSCPGSARCRSRNASRF